MTAPKPSSQITALRAVPLIPDGLSDSAAEMRRRIVTQLLERGVKPSDDLIGISEYIEKGYATEENT